MLVRVWDVQILPVEQVGEGVFEDDEVVVVRVGVTVDDVRTERVALDGCADRDQQVSNRDRSGANEGPQDWIRPAAFCASCLPRATSFSRFRSRSPTEISTVTLFVRM